LSNMYIFVTDNLKIEIMNKLFCMIATTVILIGCKEENKATYSNSESNVQKELAKIEKTTLKIKGMTCAIGCAKTIENKLNELDGIQKAKVDFNTKLATIEYDKTIHTKESLARFIESVADGKTYKVE
ncbi:heavy-metal-associated domain-containing protein, partial [Flavobacterium davisii]